MIWKVVLAIAICGVLAILLWRTRGILLTPVHIEKGEKLVVLLTASGAVPGLEGTADGVLWLIQNGTLPGRLVIVDEGMDAPTRAVAEALTRRGVELR